MTEGCCCYRDRERIVGVREGGCCCRDRERGLWE